MAVLEFDLTDPAFRSDPYPTYDHLRTTDPVHYREDRDDWVLTRHADVLSVLRHDRFGHPPLPPAMVEPRAGRPSGLGAGAFRRVHNRQRARHLQLQWMLFHDPPHAHRPAQPVPGLLHPPEDGGVAGDDRSAGRRAGGGRRRAGRRST